MAKQLDATRRRVTRLTFQDGEVVVTPKDRDIFLISAARATEACRDAVQLDKRIERFQSEILVPLHDWCLAHDDKVRACYIPTSPGRHLQVFVVTRLREFDFALAAEVAHFELKLAQSGWRVGVSQLPEADDESLATFFSPEGAFEVYADCEPAPQEGGN
ncbi:MAG: hypothetical protein ACHRHE_22920 [Tepidisphaerales bacterium]